MRFSIVLLLLVMIGRVHEVIPGVGSLPIATVAVILAAGALLMTGYARRIGLIFRVPQVRLAFLLLAFGLFSVPFALWPGGAISQLIVVAKLWVLCVILPMAIATVPQLGTVTRVFVIAAALLVTGHVLETVAGIQGFTRRQSLGFDRNDVALFAAMAIPFAIGWANRHRLLGFGLAGYLVMGIVATGSRGGFVAMLAVGAVFLLRSRILTPGRKIAILAAAVAMGIFAGSGEYWERVTGIFSNPTEDYNFQAREGRIEIWKRGLGYAAAHPVTGVGIGNFPVAEGQTLEDLGYGVKWSTAHSAYVLVLAELGFPGLLVFLLALWSIYRETSRVRRLRPRGRAPPISPADAELAGLGEATQLAFFGYVVAAAFLSAAYSVAFVFLIGVAGALHLLRHRALAIRRAEARRRASAPLE